MGDTECFAGMWSQFATAWAANDWIRSQIATGWCPCLIGLRLSSQCKFFGGELKGEVFGKTLPIASKLFIEAPRGHPVNRSEVAIEHHLLLTDRQNSNVWGFISHTPQGNGLSFSTNQASGRYQLSGGALDAITICDRMPLMRSAPKARPHNSLGHSPRIHDPVAKER